MKENGFKIHGFEPHQLEYAKINNYGLKLLWTSFRLL